MSFLYLQLHSLKNKIAQIHRPNHIDDLIHGRFVKFQQYIVNLCFYRRHFHLAQLADFPSGFSLEKKPQNFQFCRCQRRYNIDRIQKAGFIRAHPFELPQNP